MGHHSIVTSTGSTILQDGTIFRIHSSREEEAWKAAWTDGADNVQIQVGQNT